MLKLKPISLLIIAIVVKNILFKKFTKRINTFYVLKLIILVKYVFIDKLSSIKYIPNIILIH